MSTATIPSSSSQRPATLSSKNKTALSGPIGPASGEAHVLSPEAKGPLSMHQHGDQEKGPSYVHVEESHDAKPDVGLEETLPIHAEGTSQYASMHRERPHPSSEATTVEAQPVTKTFSQAYLANPLAMRRGRVTEGTAEDESAAYKSQEEKEKTSTKEGEKTVHKKKGETKKKHWWKSKSKSPKKQKKVKKEKETTVKKVEHPTLVETLEEETKSTFKESALVAGKAVLGIISKHGIRLIQKGFSSPTSPHSPYEDEYKIKEKTKTTREAKGEGVTDADVGRHKTHTAPIEHTLARSAHTAHKYASRLGHNLAKQLRRMEIVVERDDGKRIDLIRECSLETLLVKGEFKQREPGELNSIEDITLALHELSDLIAGKAMSVRNNLVSLESKIDERERIAVETGDDLLHVARRKVIQSVLGAGRKVTEKGTEITAEKVAQISGINVLGEEKQAQHEAF